QSSARRRPAAADGARSAGGARRRRRRRRRRSHAPAPRAPLRRASALLRGNVVPGFAATEGGQAPVDKPRAAMIVQIYEVATPEEGRALSALGVDHIGILVGDGGFPREQTLRSAAAIRAAVVPPSRAAALFLSPHVADIVACARALAPDIVHLGAASDLLG